VSLAVIRNEFQQAFRRPTGLQIRSWAAAVLLGLSLLLPYWRITLFAPQYPGGLRASVYLTKVGGDAAEIGILNHYIGMKPLEQAAPLERRFAVPIVLGGVLAVAASPFLGRLGPLLQAPAVVFPLGVAADLAFWMWRFGHALDPSAPIRVEPFMPAILGKGGVMQFSTHAMFSWGFFLSAITAGLALYNLLRWRRG
jgi:hypothetical protein